MMKTKTRFPTTACAAALAAVSLGLLASCESTTGPTAHADAPETTPTTTRSTASTLGTGIGTAASPAASPATATGTGVMTAAETPAPQPDFSDREMVNYAVEQGDSLWQISNDKNVSVSDIKAANNMNSDKIIAGQTLVLPLPRTAGAGTVETSPSAVAPATTEFPTSPATLTPPSDSSADAVTDDAGAPGTLAPPPPPQPATEQ